MELLRALGALAEAPAEEHGVLADVLGLPQVPGHAVYTEVFLMQLHPYASVYLGTEGMLGGEARDRVAGFWQALQQAPPAEPDHLSSLLGLSASLAEAEASERDPASARLLGRTRAALHWEHVLPWVPPFLDRIEDVGGPFYGRWASLLQEALRAELRELGALEVTPRHLIDAVPMADPRTEGARAFLAALLAPVRSGLILLRSDLARAAEDLGLGLRSGDRAFALKSLLSQDAAALLSWLGKEAGARASSHGVRLEGLGPIRQHWTSRASQTAELLASLAAEADAGVLA